MMTGFVMQSAQVLAQTAAVSEDGVAMLLRHLLAAVVFAAIGIIVLAVSFWVVEKMTPFSVMKEIEEDQNVAMAIVVAAVIIGMSIIIGAAIMG
ncbi:MAG: DUF350 domain-containing protein [Planctomycetaceae bacterium]|nr:DUF350 domain-containing protein [Planctomycetaceae bacterium]